jgi:hypothetical protein
MSLYILKSGISLWWVRFLLGYKLLLIHDVLQSTEVCCCHRRVRHLFLFQTSW